MNATVTTSAEESRRLVRRLVAVLGATVGVPVFVVIGAVVALLIAWWAGLLVGAAAGAVAGWVVVRRAWSAATHTVAGVLIDLGAIEPAVHEEPRLHNVIEGLCVAGGVSKPRVFVVADDSLNSMTAGVGGAEAILAVTSGLVEGLSRIELEGVLAHELSHIRSGDIVPATLAVTAGGLLNAVPWGRAVIQAATSSMREQTADLAGVTLTRYPPGLLAALQKVQTGETGPQRVPPSAVHLWLRPPVGEAVDDLDLRIETLREL